MKTQERKTDGVLDSTFLVDGPEDGAEDREDQESAGEEPAAAKPTDGEPQKTALPSRRQRARERDEAILSEVRAVREAQEKRDREYQEHLAAIRQENAELRGSLHAYANRPAPEAARQQTAADPEALMREAYAALDQKDMVGYHRKLAEYTKATVFADPQFQRQAQPQQPQQAQPQVHPILAATAAQYPDVMGDPVGMAIAQAHNQKLAARANGREGPETWKPAFEEARKYMAQQNGAAKGPQFSQRNAAVVAGVPTGGNGGGSRGGGSPGVILTAQEKATAKKFHMTEQQYAHHLAEMHPDRVVE